MVWVFSVEYFASQIPVDRNEKSHNQQNNKRFLVALLLEMTVVNFLE